MALSRRWTEDETRRALFLYFQLPFGKLHQGNPEIAALAGSLGRTPSSVAMKLANFASLDPGIVASGRKGLTGASALDRAVWDAVQGDWTGWVLEVGGREAAGEAVPERPTLHEPAREFRFEPPAGASTRRAEVELRVGQGFFRRAVLANFDDACCVTGIAEPRLLTASHISPWGADVANRHNPRNGLSLSATFDRAFDAHLMTVTPGLEVRVSRRLLKSRSAATRECFAAYDGRPLRAPTHLAPDPALLAAHNDRFFALEAGT